MSKTATLIQNDKRVLELELSPDIFVTLNYGYQLDGAHCFGEDTISDALRTLRRVTPCSCAECAAHLEGASV